MVEFSEVTMAVTLPPPPYGHDPRVLETMTTPHGSYEIAILSDGSLEARVQYAGEQQSQRFRTQPLAITEPHPLTLIVWRRGDSVGISLEGCLSADGVDMQTSQTAQGPSLDNLTPWPFPRYDPATAVLMGFETIPLPAGLSFEDPGVQKACQPAIDVRAKLYSRSPSSKPNNRPATQAEQLDQLRQAIKDLKELCETGVAGRTSHFKYIAGELRNLTFWKLQNGNLHPSYDPLLFRLANWASLPLPVFALCKPQMAKRKQGIFLRARAPTFTREHAEDELVDFQDWLLHDAVVTRPDNSGATPELRSIKGIILLASVALGGSHYDQLVPQDLDLFRRIQRESVDGLQSLFLKIAGTVIGLSEYVVRELEGRGFGK